MQAFSLPQKYLSGALATPFFLFCFCNFCSLFAISMGWCFKRSMICRVIARVHRILFFSHWERDEYKHHSTSSQRQLISCVTARDHSSPSNASVPRCDCSPACFTIVCGCWRVPTDFVITSMERLMRCLLASPHSILAEEDVTGLRSNNKILIKRTITHYLLVLTTRPSLADLRGKNQNL